jgi:hypothetical protein
MLTKEISDVEKGCGKNLGAYMEIPKEYEDCSEKIRNKYAYCWDVICGNQELCPICRAKLSTLKSAQAKFDKFVKDLKQVYERKCIGVPPRMTYGELIISLDELSSKQEEKE